MKTTKVKNKIALLSLALLTLDPAALASNTWYVDGVNGSDSNDCMSSATACKTIGHAISLTSSRDTIKIAPATYTENLTIDRQLKIFGSGAKTTIVDAGGAGIVFTIAKNTLVRLSKLTFQNATAGGVVNYGTLTIDNGAISGNSKTTGYGAGIFNMGTLTINNSTISGNSVSGSGGGIYNGYVLTINNSTISGNSAPNGGGIYDSSSATINNSIVAENNGGNCGGVLTSNGYNLSSDNTRAFNGPGDMNNTDPKLGPLGNYGGPTQTMGLHSGSPAIDAGNPNGCTDGNGNPLTTDQRGYPRPDKDSGRRDIGAFERQHN